MAKHRRKAYFSRGLENPFVDVLTPAPHLRAFEGGSGNERRLRECLIEVLANESRLDDCVTLVDQRRHDTLGVELKVFGPVLFVLEQIDIFRLPTQSFLNEGQKI